MEVHKLVMPVLVSQALLDIDESLLLLLLPPLLLLLLLWPGVQVQQD